MSVGELFILGFYGRVIPAWLKDFAAQFGLGGVILFDYSCQTRQYDNNIASPEQVQSLCAEIAALPSQPLVFIDQEGGRVRRLKDSLGFQPLPSAKDFNRLAMADRQAILAASYGELRRLGIRYNFAPVIDVDYNSDNPNIGRIKRSYSSDLGEVEANGRLVDAAARQARVGLCLKHYPGIGGAHVDSHLEFMDISDALRPEQEELFYALAPDTFGDTVLITHDMQMQGLQKALGTSAASLRAIAAGMDMICIGNNLFDQEQAMAGIAAAVAGAVQDGSLDQTAVRQSIARVQQRKALLA